MVSTSDRVLREAIVDLSERLVDGVDVIEFLTVLCGHSVDLLDVGEAGVSLGDRSNVQRVVASSTEASPFMELFEIDGDGGPSLDSFVSGRAVSSPDLEADRGRWPEFSAAARQMGVAGVHALPLRVRGQTIGSLNLFVHHTNGMQPVGLDLAQAMADMASVGLFQALLEVRGRELTEHVGSALAGRMVVEQAKGVLSELLGVSVQEAFVVLRRHARSSGRPLRGVAEEVVSSRRVSGPAADPLP